MGTLLWNFGLFYWEVFHQYNLQKEWYPKGFQHLETQQ